MYQEYGEIVKIGKVPGRNDMLLLFNPESFDKVFRNEGAWPLRMLLGSVQYFRRKVRSDFFQGYEGIVNE